MVWSGLCCLPTLASKLDVGDVRRHALQWHCYFLDDLVANFGSSREFGHEMQHLVSCGWGQGRNLSMFLCLSIGGSNMWDMEGPFGSFHKLVVSRSASSLLQLVCAMAYQMVEIHLSILARKWTDDSLGSDTKCFSIVSGAWFMAFEVDMVLWNTRSSSGWRKCMAMRFGLLFVWFACNWTLVSRPLANSRDLPTMHHDQSDQPTLYSLETICIVGISEAENLHIFDMVSFRQSICLMVPTFKFLSP